MYTLVAIGVAIVLIWLAYRKWQSFRAFRAEVVIECIHLWQEYLTEWYKKNPDKSPVMRSIYEEALYMSANSEHRTEMYSRAWANVKARNGKSA